MSKSSQEYFLKLKAHLPLVKDPTVVILRGHLLVEEIMEEIITAGLEDTSAIKDARLTFYQKFCIAKGIVGCKRDHYTWKPIEELNRLRNMISHKLPDVALAKKLDTVLRAYFPGDFDEIPADIYSKSKALRKGIIFHCAYLHGIVTGMAEAKKNRPTTR